jgi:HK97 family phage portal protein
MFYQINYTPLGLSGIYSSEDIFHIKGPGNSMVGQSVLAFQLETLGHALAIQNYSSKYFSGGASMSGILTFEGVNDEKKLRQYTEMFMASYTGGSIAAMPSGVKFEAMGNDPQKSQFVETENYMRGEIARWFRMPLSKLQDLSDTNNSALEQVNINYVTDCLMPWIVRFEQEADQKLYAIYERDIYDGYIDTDMLLRGDSAAMERKVRTMFTSGAITPNEVRKMYAINTIDEDYANSSYMPSNMMPGETAIPFWAAQAQKNQQLTNSQPGMGGAQQ